MRQKRTIFILLALIFFIQTGCYYYHQFQIKELRGNEAKVIKLLKNGNYLVTGGYVKLYRKLLKKKYPEKGEDWYEMKTIYFLLVEYLDGNCEVRPEIVKEVKELKRK